MSENRLLKPNSGRKNISSYQVWDRCYLKAELPKIWDTEHDCVTIILPNYVYENGHVYFKYGYYDRQMDERVEQKTLLPKLLVYNDFMVYTQKSIFYDEMDKITYNVTYKIYYEILLKNEIGGLSCNVYIPKNSNIYFEELKYLGKIIELDIMNVNPTKMYELCDIQKKIRKQMYIRRMEKENMEEEEDDEELINELDDEFYHKTNISQNENSENSNNESDF